MTSSGQSKINVLYVLDKSGFGGVQSIAYALMRQKPDDVEMHYLFLRNINGRFGMQDVDQPNVHYSHDRSRFSLSSFLTLKRLVHEKRIDVAHMNGNKAILYGILLKLFLPHLVLLAHDHGGVFDYKWWYKVALRCSRPFYRFFLCVSGRRKEFYLKECHVSSSRVKMINNFFDMERIRAVGRETVAERNGSQDTFMIGYVGGLSPLKGCDLLLRALPEIQKQLPGTCVMIAGDGPQKQRLERLADTLQVSEFVSFLGYVKQPSEVYSSIDVLVIPSRAEEGPITLYEAWASGVPVVASDAPVLDERIQNGETGIHFRSENSEDLAAKVILLARDQGLSEKVVSGGKRQVTELTCEKYVQQLETIYLEACSA